MQPTQTSVHTRKTPLHSRRGLTRVEVIVIIVVVVGVICVVLCAGMAGIFLPALAKARSSARQIKDSTQVRNVVQAMTIFANGNRDSYPVPSMLDVKNQTVETSGRAKDTSDHILSILVYNSSISPGILVSPSEASGNIAIHNGYQNAMPSAAVNPAKALWDPSLRCDFTTGTGHISYAMAMANGDTAAPPEDVKARGRLPYWSNTFNADEAVFGNRGPAVTGRDAAGNIIYDRNSVTMAIHGGRTTWEGNIGYNDNHVGFETTMDTGVLYYQSTSGKKLDILFYNEPDDKSGHNLILGVWVKAGVMPPAYKGITD